MTDHGDKAAERGPNGAEAAPAGAEAAAGAAPEPNAAVEPAPAIAPEPGPDEQLAELRERLLRAMAETENVRRRAERERAEVAKYAVTGLARDLLSVADNLRRAIASVPRGAGEADEALNTLLAGVELTERELHAVFERHAIRPLDPAGERFDPNFHQAVYEVPAAGVENGTVIAVAQLGYVIADRLLRPAMVGVARGETPPQGRVDTSA